MQPSECKQVNTTSGNKKINEAKLKKPSDLNLVNAANGMQSGKSQQSDYVNAFNFIQFNVMLYIQIIIILFSFVMW